MIARDIGRAVSVDGSARPAGLFASVKTWGPFTSGDVNRHASRGTPKATLAASAGSHRRPQPLPFAAADGEAWEAAGDVAGAEAAGPETAVGPLAGPLGAGNPAICCCSVVPNATGNSSRCRDRRAEPRTCTRATACRPLGFCASHCSTCARSDSETSPSAYADRSSGSGGFMFMFTPIRA